MKLALLCLTIGTLSACALAPAPPVPHVAPSPSPLPPPQAPPAPPPSPPPPPAMSADRVDACPLLVTFASYGTGIDGDTRARVETLLVSDRAVVGFAARHWGREGETTLCVRTRAGPDAARLFHAIRAMVPARSRAPISIRTDAGLSFETRPPR
jgi:hypothetical protein